MYSWTSSLTIRRRSGWSVHREYYWVPDQFLKKLEEVLGIKDFEPFLVDDVHIPESVTEEIAEDKKTIARLLDMIERRDEQISHLVMENTRLTQELFNIYNLRPQNES